MQVPWTLHADDDILIDVFALAKVLQSVDANSTEKFLCHSGTSPVLRKGKWSVDVAEYPALEYPYYCAGGMWILQTKQIPRLLEASKVAPFLWVDDVYICGILREHAGIKQMHLNDKYTFEFNITHLGTLFEGTPSPLPRQSNANTSTPVIVSAFIAEPALNHPYTAKRTTTHPHTVPLNITPYVPPSTPATCLTPTNEIPEASASGTFTMAPTTMPLMSTVSQALPQGTVTPSASKPMNLMPVTRFLGSGDAVGRTIPQ
ncbi:putative galactosyltransferase [Penaeus vannamei]|uniref:Hexosyltransferase n=1 Tax=Penaeus vannamei TaxID=6689 RepID=A0A423U8Z7_PENVA|nr:putative galactosyltransferase [Penaeus vannamei]